MLGDNYPYIDKNKEEYTPEEAIKILTKAQMYKHIKNAIRRYGLEGTEDKIKDLYNNSPELKEQMLNVLYEIWGK